MIFKSPKIGNILFHQVFQKQIQRSILIFIVYFPWKKKKQSENFSLNMSQNRLKICDQNPKGLALTVPLQVGSGKRHPCWKVQNSQKINYQISKGLLLTGSLYIITGKGQPFWKGQNHQKISDFNMKGLPLTVSLYISTGKGQPFWKLNKSLKNLMSHPQRVAPYRSLI